MTEWTEGDVDVDGVAIHFHRTGRGEGPPLVLAHGLTDNGLCWARTARALEDDFDIVMIDARNHGRSGTAPGDATVLAGDVAAVISALELDTPAVMGHSVGASTMTELAAEHPGEVSRLVLEDPPWRVDRNGAPQASSGDGEAIRAFLRSFADMTDTEIMALAPQQHPDWDEDEYPEWAAAKRQVREAAADAIVAPNWAASVPRIECDTLLLFGDADRGGIVTPAVAAYVERLNRRVSSRHIDGSGHSIRRENFDGFISAVRAFLAGTTEAKRS